MDNQTHGNSAPKRKLNTTRGLLKFILLSAITFGIYALVVSIFWSEDTNTICERYDGKRTMNFLLVAILSAPTLGIVPLVWFHRISARLGNELSRRNIDYQFSAADFWLWGMLGSLIFIGPFVYYHKFFKSLNLLSADYNDRG